MIPSNDLLHVFNRPAIGMSSGCSKFKVFQTVIVSDSVLVVDREALLFKPEHRFRPHRVLLVKSKPMLSHITFFSQRMAAHTDNNDVSMRRCRGESGTVLAATREAILANAFSAKSAEPKSGFSGGQIANHPAGWALHGNAPYIGLPHTAKAHIVASPYFASALIFVRSNGSGLSTAGAANLPCAVPVIHGATRWIPALRRTRSEKMVIGAQATVGITGPAYELPSGNVAIDQHPRYTVGSDRLGATVGNRKHSVAIPVSGAGPQPTRLRFIHLGPKSVENFLFEDHPAIMAN